MISINQIDLGQINNQAKNIANRNPFSQNFPNTSTNRQVNHYEVPNVLLPQTNFNTRRNHNDRYKSSNVNYGFDEEKPYIPTQAKDAAKKSRQRYTA